MDVTIVYVTYFGAKAEPGVSHRATLLHSSFFLDSHLIPQEAYSSQLLKKSLRYLESTVLNFILWNADPTELS